MNKYFYFAVIRFEEVAEQGTARTRRVPVTHFGKSVYASAALAVIANIGWICNHVGERFTVCGFDHQLNLDERGVSQGYVATDDDSLVITADLSGAVKLLKTNLKKCNVKL